jgi:NodT family efflux transporter outer membrane factor (OMF) lipoprotein
VRFICNKKIAFALLPLLLSSCASIGWQGAAETPVTTIATPAAWLKADPAIKTAVLAPDALATWWAQLNDPVLDQLIGESLSAAPDVRSAQARLRQSRASRDLATANLYPSVGASGSATRSRSTSGNTQTLYTAGFDAAWEPSIFGGLRDAANAAEADTAASAASLESVRASLVAEVALNYINLRTAQRRLGIARDNVASQGETLQITQWRAQAGLVTALDVEQARTNLEQSRASIPSLESSRAAAENHLALLTGRAAGNLHERLGADVALPKAPDNVAVGIPADTIRQRPDIRAAEFTLQAEAARTAEREADRYPSLNLSGSLGWQAFSLASLGSGGVVRSLAGSLAATLFDGGRIRSRIAAQNAVQEQALIAYEKSMLTAFEDVENALTAYAVGRERVDARQKAAESARNANALARTLYQAGSADFQKVLDTDRTRLSAEDGLASADADLLTAVIQLYKALGGGWQHA